jgi:hypothetical protein
MALQKGLLAKQMNQFILEVNKMKQEDAEKAIENYCNKLEETVYRAIRSITITIPSGFIQVQGTAVAQTNALPIRLTRVVS